MKVVVTGALGFIGSHLFNKLSSIEGLKVEAWDAYGIGADTKHIYGKPWKYVDVRYYDEVRRAMAIAQPHVIFHLAAQSHVCRSIEDPTEFFDTNAIGTVNVLEAARQIVPGARIVHVSTDEVFGEALHGAFTETTPYAPRSPYAASKAASDMAAMSYRQTYAMSITVTNCSNNFGPHQHTEKLIPMVIDAYINRGKINVHGDGSHKRDWLWVHDHVDALIRVMTLGPGPKYVIGGLNVRTNMEVIKLVQHIMEQDYKFQPVEMVFTDDRPTDDTIYEVNPSLMQSLGWSPSQDFIDNLRRTVKYYVER